jgi:ABC transporter, phosphonate, periplasmic substrate-binding protein
MRQRMRAPAANRFWRWRGFTALRTIRHAATGSVSPRSLLPALVALLALFFWAGPIAAKNGDRANHLTIGVRAPLGDERALARWQATVDLLNERIPEVKFELESFDSPTEIVLAAKRGEFDYFLTDPATFVQMELRTGARSVLSLVNEWQGVPLDRFGSVIFTRKDQSGNSHIGGSSGP